MCETRKCGFDSPRGASAVPTFTLHVWRMERAVAAGCFLSKPRFPCGKGDLGQRPPGESHREQVPRVAGAWEKSANEHAVLLVPQVF